MIAPGGLPMRKLSGIVILILAMGTFFTSAPAQEASGGVIFTRFRQFRIPFNPGAGTGRLKQLQLFVSQDQGRSWQPSATVPPDQKDFKFVTDRDGMYWFTVQTQDLDGRLYPATLEGATPSLKVVIDTVPPKVAIQPLQARGAEVGVAWDIQDENLDTAAADALKLEFRSAGAQTWLPVTVAAGANQAYWNPQTGGPVEVRLRARDRAGNSGEASTTLNAASGFVPVQPQQGNAPFQSNNQNNNSTKQHIFNGPTEGERKYVNSLRVSLNYEIKDKGPSGVSMVELWYTQDGRSWNKYLDDSNQNNIVFNVKNEGIYGVTLVAKSGVGLGDRAPQMGDRPQMWFEVDVTKPVVHLHNILVGTNGPDKGKLNITWTARDDNMARDPIKLSYAEQLAGPWTTVKEKLPNTGQYIWQMPDGVPFQFHLKVEATDLAGNVGEAVTDSLIKVDLAQPKAKILTVQPAGN
jgi:hypothetical protein